MASVFQRIAAAFRRTPATPAKPVSVPGRVLVDDVEFSVARDVDSFMAAVPDQLRIALALRTLDYHEVYLALLKAFDARYDSASQQQRAFVHACLVCSGCGWAFPGSYTSALIGMMDDYTVVSGGTRGFREFGKTGVCTRCGAGQSLLVYERFDPASIGAGDVAVLRQYWRDLAAVWWTRSGERQGVCDVCSHRPIAAGEGYLTSGSYLTCEDCLAGRLDGLLDKLRENPYYCGSAELRKARAHAGNR
jgi:hypothetical protein